MSQVSEDSKTSNRRMISDRHNIVCDGEGLMDRIIPGCLSKFAEGWIYTEDMLPVALRQAQAQGWRESKVAGRVKHICPVCWTSFLLERKGR